MNILQKYKVKLTAIIPIIPYIIIGIIAVNKGAIYFPDSYTFMDMAFNHSPVYCVFLRIVKTIFSSYFEISVMIIQYILIVLGVNIVVKTIKRIFEPSFLSLFIIQLILLAPCVYLHNIVSAVLSEALTYPLFLAIFSYSLVMFVEEKVYLIFKICILLFILILTRGQFLAIIPVLLLVLGYIITKNKTWLTNYKYILLLVFLPFITSLAEKTYNKIVFDHFVNNSMNYVHLITGPFYVSNQKDINLFTEKEERDYFNLIYGSLFDADLTRSQAINANIDDYQFYHQNFSNICNKRIYNLGLKIYESQGYSFVESNIALNRLCKKMIFPLVKENINNWMLLFLKNLKNSFGSFKQMLFFLMLFFYACFGYKKTNKNVFKFTLLAVMFMIANNSLIALVIHSIKRYIFYFDWVIFAVFLLLINEVIKQNHLNES